MRRTTDSKLRFSNASSFGLSTIILQPCQINCLLHPPQAVIPPSDWTDLWKNKGLLSGRSVDHKVYEEMINPRVPICTFWIPSRSTRFSFVYLTVRLTVFIFQLSSRSIHVYFADRMGTVLLVVYLTATECQSRCIQYKGTRFPRCAFLQQ